MNQQEPLQLETQTDEEGRDAERLAIAERRARNAEAARREFQSPTRNIFPGRAAYLVVWGVLAFLVYVFYALGFEYPLFAAGSLVMLWGLWGLTGWVIRNARGQQTYDS